MKELKGINIYNNDGKILTDKMINTIRKIIAQNREGNLTLVIERGTVKKYIN